MTSTKWREPLRDRAARWLFARMITREYREDLATGCAGEIQEECAAALNVDIIFDDEEKEEAVAVCERCSYVHDRSMAVCINRFSGEPPQYRASYEGAPVRATRDEAEADMCAFRAAERNKNAI